MATTRTASATTVIAASHHPNLDGGRVGAGSTGADAPDVAAVTVTAPSPVRRRRRAPPNRLAPRCRASGERRRCTSRPMPHGARRAGGHRDGRLLLVECAEDEAGARLRREERGLL